MTKLIIHALIFVLLLSKNISAQTFGSFTDPRDNRTYRTLQIGDQTWMAENLKFSTKNNGPYYGGDTYSIENFNKYGGLYKWVTACKACPDGWHLPSRNEWYELINNFGEIYTDKFLRSSLKEYKKIPKEERKERERVTKDVFNKLIEGGSSGFEALFGGYFDPDKDVIGKAYHFESNGYFWTVDKVDDKTLFGKAYGFAFNNSNKLFGPFVNLKRYAFSVRCIKDNISVESEEETQ